MTRYYVDISADLVNEYRNGNARLPDGFRLIERWGPRFKDAELWIVEDDYAGEEFEGYLIMPVFTMRLIGDGPEYSVEVTSREIC